MAIANGGALVRRHAAQRGLVGTQQGHHLPQRGQWLGLRLRFSLTHSLKLTHSLYTHSDSHSSRTEPGNPRRSR